MKKKAKREPYTVKDLRGEIEYEDGDTSVVFKVDGVIIDHDPTIYFDEKGGVVIEL